MNKKDFTGQRFGRLLVIEMAGSDKYKRSLWNCKCDCGNFKVVSGNHLQTGNSTSCGCLQKETRAANGKSNTVHGLTNSPIMRAWQSMKDRCYNPKTDSYKYYGGRGITVCDEWRDSFYSFVVDMGQTFKEGLTLDRKDSNKGYSKDNCRWATRKEQQNNLRNNVIIETPKGKMTIAIAAETFNIPAHRLYDRVSAGKPIADLFKEN
jgi:hypothetical protein